MFRVGDTFVSLLNRCPHQGGPLCSGAIYPMARASATPGQILEWYDETSPVVACPWHGWEIELATGECVADRARKVMRFPVQVIDGDVVVTVPERRGVGVPLDAESSDGDRLETV